MGEHITTQLGPPVQPPEAYAAARDYMISAGHGDVLAVMGLDDTEPAPPARCTACGNPLPKHGVCRRTKRCRADVAATVVTAPYLTTPETNATEGGVTIMTNAHILIVTPDRDDPTDEDLFTYEVECPGVTDACRRYEDCGASAEELSLLDDSADGKQPLAHGARHISLDGVWCAETDQCNVSGHEALGNDVAGRFAPGRHPVEFDFGDGTEIVILPPDGEVTGQ